MDVIDIPSASVAASIVQIDEYAVGREQSTAESSNGGDRMKMQGKWHGKNSFHHLLLILGHRVLTCSADAW